MRFGWVQLKWVVSLWQIGIALEELGFKYDEHIVNIRTNDQFKPEFLKIAPNNKIPAIVDPDGPDGKPIEVWSTAYDHLILL